MTLLLDTSAYTALLAGDTRVADALNRCEAVLLSPVVVGELLDGFAGGSRAQENRRLLEAFQERPRVRSLSITRQTAEWFAEIRQQLRRKGTPIPMNDVWIAASCLEHGARLITFDKHFESIEGLLREQP